MTAHAPETPDVTVAGEPVNARRPSPGDVTPGISSRGWLWALTLMGLGAALSALGAATVVQVAMPVVGVLVSAVLVLRRRWIDWLELLLWTWAVAPGLRRVVDFQSSFHSVSPILVAAPAMSLVGLLSFRWWRRRVDVTVGRFIGFFALMLCLGTAVGLVSAGGSAVASAFLNWAGPLFVGLGMLLLPFSDDDLRRMLTRFTRGAILVLGTYGIIQFLFAPAWDSAWLLNVSDVASSFGRAGPYEIRVFSLSNSPGPFASLLGTLLVLHAGMPRWRWGWLTTIIGVVALALSLVRSEWIAVALALTLVIWRGRARVIRGAALLATATILLVSVAPQIQSVVEERLSSLSAGSQDESFQARFAFQVRVLPALVSDPFGAGLGSSGSGARVSTTSNAFSDSDSGYVSLFRNFGAVFGAIASLGAIVVSVTVFMRSRARDGLTVAAAAVAASLPVALLFGSSFESLAGVAVWVPLAFAGRLLSVAPSSQAHLRSDQARWRTVP